MPFWHPLKTTNSVATSSTYVRENGVGGGSSTWRDKLGLSGAGAAAARPDLAAVLDAFSTANALAKMSGASALPFQTKVVGLRKTVTTAKGLSVPVTSATRAQTPDAVVMPAINRIMPEPLVQALASGEVREAGAVLRKWSGRAALTAAACVGTFVLAEATLLDGEEATTTWWLAPLFRQRYPRVLITKTIVQHYLMAQDP